MARTLPAMRTVWISDIHLGTRSCKADLLLSFLQEVRADTLYLVGDIIDLWKAKSGLYWNAAQNQVLRRVLELSAEGTRVVFVPGNHDEYFRDFLGMDWAGIEIRDRVSHETADGRRLLVIHGDEFDAFVCEHKWLAIVGGHLYDWTVTVNTALNWVRRKIGLGYWSLSQYLKLKAKQATKVIGNFERVVTDYARHQGFDGVVCGHIHKPEMRDIDGVLYCNDGDWVESCTALVEDEAGELRLLDWPELLDARRAAERRRAGVRSESRIPAAAAAGSAARVVPQNV
jgi:UDP-2,3-diacylglucosamine pyrophosphatase LpxH